MTYLKAEIDLGNPVVLSSTIGASGEHQAGSIREHAVVVVGYEVRTDGKTILSLHDPEPMLGEGQSGICIYKDWDWLVDGMLPNHILATMAVPKDGLDSNLPEVTVNINQQAFKFVDPTIKKEYMFVWDYTNPHGYAFLDDTSKTVEVLPGSVKTLKRSGGIEIINASRTNNKTVSLLLEVSRKSLEKEEAFYSLRKDLDVPANSFWPFNWWKEIKDSIPVDEFRDNSQTPTWYYFTISAYDGDKLADKATVDFAIDKEEIKIDSITPDKGVVGSQVTISGTGFGTVRGHTDLNIVTFNNVAVSGVVSWGEKEIIVKVPDGAITGTGPVIVRRGSVESNKDKVFTIYSGPHIFYIVPDKGPVGTVVTISGFAFGATQGWSTVKFNQTLATTLVSWKDDEIKVKVPDGATTGPVIVKVVSFESNPVNFTVEEPPEATITGEIDKEYSFTLPWYFGEKEQVVTISGTWALAGKGALLISDSGQGGSLTVAQHAQATLNISANASLKESQQRYDWLFGDGYTIMTYNDPELVAPQDISVPGLTCHISALDEQVTVDFTFSSDEPQLHLQLEIEVEMDWVDYDSDGNELDRGEETFVFGAAYFKIEPD